MFSRHTVDINLKLSYKYFKTVIFYIIIVINLPIAYFKIKISI